MNNTTPYNTSQPKKRQVRDMFNRIAPHYDSFNHTLSLNIDRWWRLRAVNLVRDMAPTKILDLATGTADMAIALAERISSATIIGVDLSTEMLAVARQKVARSGVGERITLLEGDAEHLDFPDNEFDVVTVGFGVRNFGDLERGLREIQRTIKPGGHTVILEFSRPQNHLIRALYEFYTFRILPRVGMLFSRDRNAWRYLPASVKAFPEAERFLEMMLKAGFTSCSATSLSFGTVQIYIGEKL